MELTPDLKVAVDCLKEAVRLIGNGQKEDVLRHSLTDHMARMFTPRPWWVGGHVRGSEANAAFAESGKKRRGFIDNLVGLTAIEYEADLTKRNKFDEGFGQVRQYCASLLNEGEAPDLVEGILSDTVRWYAYKVKSIVGTPSSGRHLGGEDVELELIEEIDLSLAGELEAKKLVGFLTRYLGREGARPLSARTLATDLGLESVFCNEHTQALVTLVDRAFSDDPKYAKVIETLWRDFVLYLGDELTAGGFDRSTYVRELYILTLAKLLCANVLERKGLLSDDGQLRDILEGRYFDAKGLTNLVEYDYFGWLNVGSRAAELLPIARAMQEDLRAYNFTSNPAEDLFGEMMAQLAYRSQRLLLGQEWTPTWLAARIVEKVFSMIPAEDEPRLVDMCCGSGAMIVEAVKLAKGRLAERGELDVPGAAVRLSQVITGFDIDPLAVMLSKIGWTLAAREALGSLDGSSRLTIPVYQADSLFATTPLSKNVDQELGHEVHTLRLAEQSASLPSFLVSPKFRALFDALLERGYALAMESAKLAPSSIAVSHFEALAQAACEETGAELDASERARVVDFLRQLVHALDILQRDGRNGIWAFILRNSYRPGLLAGQFNGVVTNPPWLALSRIADNPYKAVLREKAEAFAIKPPGSSHLHIELATIFLLHAIDRYLWSDAPFGCVLPDTVLTGHHHNPFRLSEFLKAPRPVNLHVKEIWRVGTGAFKNEAIVLFGNKTCAPALEPIPGKLATSQSLEARTFRAIKQGNRIAWSDNPAAISGGGFFNPANFRQGADIMPRTLVFHDAQISTGSGRTARWRLGPINRVTSPLGYLVDDAKQFRDFRLTAGSIPDRFMFNVLLSKHLSPFEISVPAKGLLPIEKNVDGEWSPCDPLALTACPSAKAAFEDVLRTYGPGKTISDFFQALNTTRHKLAQQSVPTSGYLVFTGAGGGLVCAAYAEASRYEPDKLIIDQTLYWASVSSEEEALYLVGLLNSAAVSDVIKEFQPRGQFGERHVHTLPFGVTPPFDPGKDGHMAVVDTTRSLISEWYGKRVSDSDVANLLDPNTNLARRRSKLREKIAELNSYGTYTEACRDLYGL